MGLFVEFDNLIDLNKTNFNHFLPFLAIFLAVKIFVG